MYLVKTKITNVCRCIFRIDNKPVDREGYSMENLNYQLTKDFPRTGPLPTWGEVFEKLISTSGPDLARKYTENFEIFECGYLKSWTFEFIDKPIRVFIANSTETMNVATTFMCHMLEAAAVHFHVFRLDLIHDLRQEMLHDEVTRDEDKNVVNTPKMEYQKLIRRKLDLAIESRSGLEIKLDNLDKKIDELNGILTALEVWSE